MRLTECIVCGTRLSGSLDTFGQRGQEVCWEHSGEGYLPPKIRPPAGWQSALPGYAKVTNKATGDSSQPRGKHRWPAEVNQSARGAQ